MFFFTLRLQRGSIEYIITNNFSPASKNQLLNIRIISCTHNYYHLHHKLFFVDFLLLWRIQYQNRWKIISGLFSVNCTKVLGNDIAIKEWQQKRNCGQGAKKYLRYLFTLAKVDMAKKIHRVFPSIVSSLGKCFLLNSFPHFFTNSEHKKGKL